MIQRHATENWVSQNLDNYYLKSEANNLHTEILDYVDNEVAALVNSAPETLDTIGELAAAFKENQDMVATLDAAITTKVSKEELQNTKEELENQIIVGLRPPPAVTSYSRPTSIPITSGM
jgi:erythromycin esterase-like protein